MIDTLLDLDSEGKPTFKWAKTVTGSDRLSVPDPNNSDLRVEVWNPSRACCLAVLLLTPIRGVQARWLDQGLLDQEIYDPETNSMIENTHYLRHWRYPEADTHEKRYGRASGVLQKSANPLTGAEELSIFVNTNKTQLWDGSRKTGYEMPWPDGSELLASDSHELRSQGQWLARVYEIIRYQLRWLQIYDADPQPLSFFHVHEDACRVDDQEDVRTQIPWFVPLFRDLTNHITYDRDGNHVLAHGPIPKNKLLKLYHALATETQKRLNDKGVPANLVTKGKDTNGYRGNLCCYDIHSLRVAGISNLIEMGVPAHIVSEYIAGHATVLMTLRYLKFQPFHIRQKLMDGMLSGDIFDSFEDIIEKIKSGELAPDRLLKQHDRYAPHLEELPEDFTAFVLVPGGLCVMGGKGSRCDVGGVNYRTVESGQKCGEVIEEYGPVNGGCGNCRFFVTGPPFLLHQALAANEIMLKMRSLGRERKGLFSQLSGLENTIDGCADVRKRAKLEIQGIGMRERLAAMEENLRPLVLEWFNRYQLFEESRQMLEISQSESDSTECKKLALFTQLGDEDFDYSPETMETTDFGLVRNVVEQARFLHRKGIVIPDDAGRMLREFMDKILSQHSSDKLLLQIKDPILATEAASMLANFVADMAGDTEAQSSIDNMSRLAITESEEDKLRLISSLVIDAANNGMVLSLGAIMEVHPNLAIAERPKRNLI